MSKLHGGMDQTDGEFTIQDFKDRALESGNQEVP